MLKKKKKIEKRRIINIEPYGVDLVDTPAIKKKFLIIKRDTSAGIILDDSLVLVAKKKSEVEDDDLVVVSKEIQEQEKTEEKTLLERFDGFILDCSDDISQEVRDKLTTAIRDIVGEKPNKKEEVKKPEETKVEDDVLNEIKKPEKESNQPVARTGETGEAEVVNDPSESDSFEEPTEEEISEYMEQKIEEEVGVLSAQE